MLKNITDGKHIIKLDGCEFSVMPGATITLSDRDEERVMLEMPGRFIKLKPPEPLVVPASEKPVKLEPPKKPEKFKKKR